MRFACAGSADQYDVPLLSDKGAVGEVAHHPLVDRRVLESEVVDIFGERQFGDGELISDRARLLFRYLGPEQVADQSLRLMLTFERRRQAIKGRLPRLFPSRGEPVQTQRQNQRSTNCQVQALQGYRDAQRKADLGKDVEVVSFARLKRHKGGWSGRINRKNLYFFGPNLEISEAGGVAVCLSLQKSACVIDSFELTFLVALVSNFRLLWASSVVVGRVKWKFKITLF